MRGKRNGGIVEKIACVILFIALILILIAIVKVFVSADYGHVYRLLQQATPTPGGYYYVR